MIERDPPFYFDVSCDSCSAGNERVDAEDFMEAVDYIKKQGWTIKYEEGEYVHICPDCSDLKSEMFDSQ